PATGLIERRLRLLHGRLGQSERVLGRQDIFFSDGVVLEQIRRAIVVGLALLRFARACVRAACACRHVDSAASASGLSIVSTASPRRIASPIFTSAAEILPARGRVTCETRLGLVSTLPGETISPTGASAS